MKYYHSRCRHVATRILLCNLVGQKNEIFYAMLKLLNGWISSEVRFKWQVDPIVDILYRTVECNVDKSRNMVLRLGVIVHRKQ